MQLPLFTKKQKSGCEDHAHKHSYLVGPECTCIICTNLGIHTYIYIYISTYMYTRLYHILCNPMLSMLTILQTDAKMCFFIPSCIHIRSDRFRPGI